MEHRKRAHVAVVLVDVREDEAVRVVPERRVCRPNALRRTGRPRRVDQTEVIPRLDRACHCRPLIRDTVQQFVEGDRGPGKPGRRRPADDHDLFEARGVDPDEPLGELVMRDENLGVGDLESVLEIAAFGGEVERCVHAADSVRAEPGADDIRPGGNPDRDVVTDLDADLLQCMTRAPRLPGGFAVRPLFVLEDEIRLVGRRLRPRREQIRDDGLLAGRERGWGRGLRTHRLGKLN